MKLKYLLPVATIASVATIVTPLVTSCGKKDLCTATWTKGEEYKPLNPKPTTRYEDRDALTVGYHDAVKANRFIYSDDMVYWYYLGSLSPSNVLVKYDIQKVSYTTISVGDVEEKTPSNINNDSEWTKFFRLTFDVTLTASIIIDPQATGTSPSTLVYNNTNVHIVDMPMYFYSDSGLYIDSCIQEGDTKWSIEMPEIKCDASYNFSLGENKTYNDSVVGGLQPPLDTMFNMFCEYLTKCQSNYFDDAYIG